MNFPNKTISFTAILLAGIFLSSCSNTNSLNEKQSGIDSISKRWVPDGREGIFNIIAENGKNGKVILKGETSIPDAKAEVLKLYSNSTVIEDSIAVLPDTLKDNRIFGVVTISVSSLRKDPDHTAELVSQSILGTPVQILKNEDYWVLVQTPDKYIAWMEGSSVILMTRNEFNQWKARDKVIYLNNAGWVYSSIDKKDIVSDITAGGIVLLTSKEKSFVKIELPDGREGYLPVNEVADVEEWKQYGKSADDILRVASTFLGTPYLWGGSSTKAVDCSGFVQSVYFQNGLILPRDASLQAKHGMALNISEGFDELEKGDLLFFGWKNDTGPHVTHVAIYRGNKEYIHSSGRVMINSLDSTSSIFNGYRLNSILGARRVIGSQGDKGIVAVKEHPWYSR